MADFPEPLDGDPDDVVTALEVGAMMWARGERNDALKWLRKAVDAAFDGGVDDRGLALSKTAALLSTPPPAAVSTPPVAEGSAPPSAVASSRPMTTAPTAVSAPAARVASAATISSRPFTATTSTTPIEETRSFVQVTDTIARTALPRAPRATPDDASEHGPTGPLPTLPGGFAVAEVPQSQKITTRVAAVSPRSADEAPPTVSRTRTLPGTASSDDAPARAELVPGALEGTKDHSHAEPEHVDARPSSERRPSFIAALRSATPVRPPSLEDLRRAAAADLEASPREAASWGVATALRVRVFRLGSQVCLRPSVGAPHPGDVEAVLVDLSEDGELFGLLHGALSDEPKP